MKPRFFPVAVLFLALLAGCAPEDRQAGKGCPGCGAAETIPVVYGEVPGELVERAERGEIALGGCCLIGDDPDVACAECGTFYRSGETTETP